MRNILILVFYCFGISNTLFAQNIKINEILASNETIISDELGEFDDFIEIYNADTYPINLAGYYISDNENIPDKFRIPFSNSNLTTIQPGGYLILWADNDPEQGLLHLNFRLSKRGDYVGLYQFQAGEFQIVDQLEFGAQEEDISFGRQIDGTGNFVYFTVPSPGSSNSGSTIDILQKPNLSHSSGFYTNAFELSIESIDDNVDIYYTLDGSDPDENSKIYTEPLRISSRIGTPNGISTIRTTSQHGFSYWENPEVELFKATIIKVRTSRNGNSFSDVVTRTFFVDKDINERFTMPVVSLITDSLSFFGADSGIYVPGNNYDGNNWRTANFSMKGSEWERKVFIDYFNQQGQLILSQDAGARISGHGSRTTCIKTIRLYAKNKYGKPRFNYELFPDERISDYKRLLLRNSGQDASYTYFRDVFAHSLANEMNLDNQSYQPVVVFVNGEYWGLHNLRERQDKYYLENHYNINPDEVDILELNNQVIEGDSLHYDFLDNFLKDNDLYEPENYNTLDTLMDIDYYMRYSTLILFAGNVDWPQNNIKFWRKKTEFNPDADYGNDGRWRWLLYDLDYCFGRVESISFNSFDYVLHEQSGWSTRLITSLLGTYDKLGSSKYRKNFINYFADQLNTNFSTERLLTEIERIRSGIAVEMQNHIDRWGNIHNLTTWDNRIQLIRDFAVVRQANIREYMMNEFSEISDTLSLTLNVSNSEYGFIKINTTEINELTKGVDVNPYPWTGIYFKDFPIRLEAIPIDGFEFVRWEGIDMPDSSVINVELSDNIEISAVFEQKTNWNSIIINEINYNPGSGLGNDADYEFIELYNPGNSFLNLTNYYFGSGIEIVFPPGAHINGGEYIIITPNMGSYSGQGYNVYECQGRLSNSGEIIKLYDPSGNLVDSVLYYDGGRWPGNPDGFGFSLELIDYKTDNSNSQNWRSSYIPGGSPGAANSIYSNPDALVINEVLSNGKHYIKDESGQYDDWIEIYNNSTESVYAAGLFISDDNDIDRLENIPINQTDNNLIPPGGFLRLWADNEPEQGIFHMDFKLNSGGEKLYLYKVENKQYIIIDSVSIPNIEDDVSYGRYPDGMGDFYKLGLPSPGAKNLLRDTIPEIAINELMAINTSSFSDENSEYEDWIEIYNYGETTIDIGGLFITDSLDDPYKSRIPLGNPEITNIPPDGFIRLWADNHLDQSLLHIGFKLSGTGEQLGLTQMLLEPLVLDSIDFGIQTDGISFGRFPDGSANLDYFEVPTPAIRNHSDGERIFSSLVINELMARNTNYFPDEYGYFEDWIEIFNKGEEKIDIGGLFLSDDFNSPTKIRIPPGQPHITFINPGDYLVLFADLKPELGVRHINFQLMGAGERVALTCYKNGIIDYIDSLSYPVQSSNISYGRATDGSAIWQYFENPSPGSSNGVLDILSNIFVPSINLEVYPNPFTEQIFIKARTDFKGKIKMSVFNAHGSLLYNQDKNGLPFEKLLFEWNGTDRQGRSLSPGIYIIQLSNESYIDSKKVIISK